MIFPPRPSIVFVYNFRFLHKHNATSVYKDVARGDNSLHMSSIKIGFETIEARVQALRKITDGGRH